MQDHGPEQGEIHGYMKLLVFLVKIYLCGNDIFALVRAL